MPGVSRCRISERPACSVAEMLFTSWSFIGLVLATFVAFYVVRSSVSQSRVLILASMIFYGFGQPGLLGLLLFSAVVNGICSWGVEQASSAAGRRTIASVGVIVNLAVLGFFKYAGLLATTLAGLRLCPATIEEWLVAVPLPVGISFFTFQGISLVVDTWRLERPNIDAEKAATLLGALEKAVFFIIFFPQLVAGPIVKARDFYPQIVPKRLADVPWRTVIESLVAGYFLKLVVADNLKDQTIWMQYPYYVGHSSVILAALLVGYSAQIFADFAGYSLIAVGLAALFGYELMQNFDFPYIADSFGDFWRRWHISLSSWLREYLYIPLGGNRHGEYRTLLNVFLVMFLGGLWHGAAWKYAAWGGFHGLALAIERPFRGTRLMTSRRWPYVVGRTALVFVGVSLAWLLFVMPSFGGAVAYGRAMVTNTGQGVAWWLGLGLSIYIAPVILYHAIGLPAVRRRVPDAALPILYGIMLALIVFNHGNTQPFIYFQF